MTPVVASRPRVGRWGTYYSATYKKFKEVDGPAALKSVPTLLDTPMDKPFHIDVSFVCHKPKTTKLSTPRGDIDNYLKALFDLLVSDERWLADDDLICSVFASKRFASDGEEPRIHVTIHTEETP